MINSENKDLIEIAQRVAPNPHGVTKQNSYYKIYQDYFKPFVNKQINLLEVGVYTGESLKVFSEFFSESNIVGIDLEMKDIDFSQYPNVSYEQADQTNNETLTNISEKFAPQGWDIIIDDASHIGSFSQKTFESLFPKLKSGGIYIVEDWGTGYWQDWPDGGIYEKFQTTPLPGTFIKRIPSHDYGMVGFVKTLVDLVHIDSVRLSWKSEPIYKSSIEYIHYYPGVVVLRKL